jgi:hypothetical protein
VLEGDICWLLNDSIANLLGTVASHELSVSPVALSEKKPTPSKSWRKTGK